MDRDQQHLSVTLEAKIDALTLQIDGLRRKVTRLDDTIRGNGSTGLLERMAVHEEKQKSVFCFIDEVKSYRRWLFVSVFSLVASMGWQAVTWVQQNQ
jgi:hypothetical protein